MSKKILIVDDNEEILEILNRKLVSEGYQIERETTGEGAIAKAKSFLPQLILMDIVLPDLDGADVVKVLQEDPVTTNIAVLFVSGIVTPEEEGKKAELNVGGRSYPALNKPFGVQELLSAIEELLN